VSVVRADARLDLVGARRVMVIFMQMSAKAGATARMFLSMPVRTQAMPTQVISAQVTLAQAVPVQAPRAQIALGAVGVGLASMLLVLVLATALSCAAVAGEVADKSVAEPSTYRMDDFRSPVPLTLKGAKAITADEAADLWNKNAAIFIDVYPQAPKPANLPAGTYWREPEHRSIEGATWLPNVGYGALSSEMDAYFRTRLETLTAGDRNAAVVFFCLKDCWMSWNAAKRALAYGYRNVMWFRNGTDDWQELGYPLVAVKKVR
jgi:PQQ-dependent catabolism-associated CXXCW motif protein